MLNRRMPNGMYWWCERGEKISPTRLNRPGRGREYKSKDIACKKGCFLV